MWFYITWRYKLVIEVKRPGEESVKKATKTFRFIFSLKYFNQLISDSLFLTQDPECCRSFYFVLQKSNSLYLLHRRKRCRWTSANMTILKLIVVFRNIFFFLQKHHRHNLLFFCRKYLLRKVSFWTVSLTQSYVTFIGFWMLSTSANLSKTGFTIILHFLTLIKQMMAPL